VYTCNQTRFKAYLWYVERDDEREKTKFVSILDYYNLLTTRVGLNLISHANHVLKVSIYDELVVAIDENRLQQQQPNAIDITVNPEFTKELGQWCKGLKPLMINKSQIPKVSLTS
jgi:hypothetical protein